MQEEAAEESDDIFRILRMRKRDVRPYRSQSYFGSGDDDIESKDLDLEEPLNYDSAPRLRYRVRMPMGIVRRGGSGISFRIKRVYPPILEDLVPEDSETAADSRIIKPRPHKRSREWFTRLGRR